MTAQVKLVISSFSVGVFCQQLELSDNPDSLSDNTMEKEGIPYQMKTSLERGATLLDDSMEGQIFYGLSWKGGYPIG